MTDEPEIICVTGLLLHGQKQRFAFLNDEYIDCLSGLICGLGHVHYARCLMIRLASG
jgi:hypothetical protein